MFLPIALPKGYLHCMCVFASVCFLSGYMSVCVHSYVQYSHHRDLSASTCSNMQGHVQSNSETGTFQSFQQYLEAVKKGDLLSRISSSTGVWSILNTEAPLINAFKGYSLHFGIKVTDRQYFMAVFRLSKKLQAFIFLPPKNWSHYEVQKALKNM